jgi:DNA-binding GntR family transcriptional regulator
MASSDIAATEDTSDTRLGKPGQRLNAQVVKKVRELIMSGTMPGGSRLRTEHLAEQLGVSATPVREALMALAGEGMVSFEPGRGFRVLPMSRQDVLDLYDVQAYLSGELAARASVNLTGDDQDRLDEIQDKLVAAVEAGDSAAVEEADFAVHQLINRAAAAPKLVWLLSLTLRYVPFSMYGHIKGWELAARDDHALIFRGLRNRSGQAAAEAMRAHIRNAGIIIANHLSEQGVITEQ